MNAEEYEDEIRRLRESGVKFRSTVVAALNATIERLDEENAKLRDTLEERTVEKVYGVPMHKPSPNDTAIRELLEDELAETKRTLAIVTRDRDALVQRAVTAENTLRNHGFDMHTMTRKKSGPIIGPQGTTSFGAEWGRGHTGGTIP